MINSKLVVICGLPLSVLAWIFAKFFSYSWFRYAVDKILLITNMQFLKISGYFLTWELRPQSAEFAHSALPLRSPAFLNSQLMGTKAHHSDVAIVIQGPIVDVNFLSETLKLYRKNFPGIFIVLSTWKHEKEHVNKLPEELVDEVVLSDMPNNHGVLNINLQIISTTNGLAAIDQNSIKYCLKTRTDQRIYNNNSVSYLKELLLKYPPIINSKQNSRIICLDVNTSRYRPYSVSDMFQFATVSELNEFWQVELDGRRTDYLDRLKRQGEYSLWSAAINEVTEAYLGVRYARKMLDPFEFSFSMYWNYLRDFHIIVDRSVLDLVWQKYTALEHGVCQTPRYASDRLYEKVSNMDWYLLQQGYQFDLESSSIAKRPIYT